MNKTNPKVVARLRRKKHIIKKIRGTAEKPRLSVFRSNKHIYAQIIDDQSAKTLVSASTLSKEISSLLEKTGNTQAAQKVGELIAQKALGKDIDKVVFDRNGFLYHGRLKAVADAAREAGLKF